MSKKIYKYNTLEELLINRVKVTAIMNKWFRMYGRDYEVIAIVKSLPGEVNKFELLVEYDAETISESDQKHLFEI